MGNRANVVIEQYPSGKKKGRIFLYTHWGGSDLPRLLQEALARKQRWTDDSYLARIIFSAMVKDDIDGETGYGISTSQPDNEHDYLVVDCEQQTVTRETESGETIKTWTFEQFLTVDLGVEFASY